MKPPMTFRWRPPDEQAAKVPVLSGEKPFLALGESTDEHEHHPQTKQHHRQPQRTDHLDKAVKTFQPRAAPRLAHRALALRYLWLNDCAYIHSAAWSDALSHGPFKDYTIDRKSTRLNSSHIP